MNARPCWWTFSRSHSRRVPNSPALELLVQVAEVCLRPLPQLNRDDVPERIGREVPHRHVRPVDVLQDADDDVGRLKSEVLAHLRVERIGQILERELAGEQCALELEAEDDVQAVRHLVGVDSAERRLHLVQRTVECLERDVAELLREVLLQLRIEETPGRDAAPDEVLPHAALRLVERGRHALRERRTGVTPD